jgi:hypothetical protein
MRPRHSSLLLAATAVWLAAASFGAQPVPAPDCAKCKDIARMQRELDQQKVARDAFREFTYDAQGKEGMQRVKSIRELQAAHAALFAQMMNGGKKPKGKGGIVAKPALGTNAPECTMVEYVDGREIPLNEEQYKKKECLFADYLIEHEKKHVEQCERAKAEGLLSTWEDPVVAAEREVRAYQKAIDLLEAQLASLRAGCQVAMSGPKAPPDQALASASGLSDLQRQARLAAQALKKGWS